MADITMCMNDQCPKSQTCYRHTAVPSPYRQAYAVFEPEDGECIHYWETDENKEQDECVPTGKVKARGRGLQLW